MTCCLRFSLKPCHKEIESERQSWGESTIHKYGKAPMLAGVDGGISRAHLFVYVWEFS